MGIMTIRRSLPLHLKIIFIMFYFLVAYIDVLHLPSFSIRKEAIPQNPVNSYSVFSNRPINWENLDQRERKENIYAVACHLRNLLDYFAGNQYLALAAYNDGVSRVLIHKGVPPFKETRNFIQKVLFSFQYYSQQKKG